MPLLLRCATLTGTSQSVKPYVLHFIVQAKARITHGVEGKNREQTAAMQTALLQSLSNHRPRSVPKMETAQQDSIPELA